MSTGEASVYPSGRKSIAEVAPSSYGSFERISIIVKDDTQKTLITGLPKAFSRYLDSHAREDLSVDIEKLDGLRCKVKLQLMGVPGG